MLETLKKITAKLNIIVRTDLKNIIGDIISHASFKVLSIEKQINN